MLFTLFRLPQSIRPLEFTVKNDKLSIGFVEATMYSPMVAKGSICKDMNVYPAECRGRRCSYKGKLVVSLSGVLKNRVHVRGNAFIFLSPQADVSWSINGVPKGIIKQSLGQLPIMVKSKLCNLCGLTPKELVEHHEEAEVRWASDLWGELKFMGTAERMTNRPLLITNRKWAAISSLTESRRLSVC